RHGCRAPAGLRRPVPVPDRPAPQRHRQRERLAARDRPGDRTEDRGPADPRDARQTARPPGSALPDRCDGGPWPEGRRGRRGPPGAGLLPRRDCVQRQQHLTGDRGDRGTAARRPPVPRESL
ncbi:MAG: RuvA, partial [uncultured Thermomicrobiales bacterium]